LSKKKIYFLVNGEGRIVDASVEKFKSFDDRRFSQAERDLDFPLDFEENKNYYLGRLLNRKLDQVGLA
jgi:hypothetical protein